MASVYKSILTLIPSLPPSPSLSPSADRYANDEINLEEYLEGLSFVVAKDKTIKRKNK